MKIKFKNSEYFVSGFNKKYSCVQMTTLELNIKKFKTIAAAEKFIEKYSGAGYGLKKDNVYLI